MKKRENSTLQVDQDRENENKELTQSHDELAVLARDVTGHRLTQGLIVHPLVGLRDLLQSRGAELALQLLQQVNCITVGIVKLGDHFLKREKERAKESRR